MTEKIYIDTNAQIDPSVTISDGCIIKCGSYICKGVFLEPFVYLGPNVVFIEAIETQSSKSRVGHNAWIGGNSTIYPDVTISANAVVRPGSVVTRSVPPNAIVEGNPATIVGYADSEKSQSSTIQPPKDVIAIEKTPVRGVTIHHFPIIQDLRGNLSFGEFERDVPFIPKRYFIVYGVPTREVRGEHAHHNCHQFLICIHGSCAIMADDGQRKVEIPLSTPQVGVYLPPMTWGVQYKYSPDAILLVFASDYYDPNDYIRDYSDFLKKQNAI